MNIAPYPTENQTPSVAPTGEINSAPHNAVDTLGMPPQQRTGKSWVFSLTLVCFLFGAALALQLRAMNQVRINDERKAEGLAQAQAKLQVMKSQYAKEVKQKHEIETRLKSLQTTLTNKNVLSSQKAKLLNAQINQLQLVAGLTSVSGPGVIVIMNDNPNAAKGGDPNLAPGIVHDFDVLQIVNELRAAKADAISVNGTRITSYTPIRCVGPTIYINWEPKPAPFRIEAVGDPEGLKSSLNLPGGIVDKLKSEATLAVKVESARRLHLPAAETVPNLKVAKSD